MAFFDHMAVRGEARTVLLPAGASGQTPALPFFLATSRRATLTTSLIEP